MPNMDQMTDAELGVGPEPEFGQIPPAEEPQEIPKGFSLNLGWLRTPTGEGTIEERLDHPFNPHRSMGIAQVIRGVEGLLGDLSLAVVDILLGSLQIAKETKTPAGV